MKQRFYMEFSMFLTQAGVSKTCWSKYCSILLEYSKEHLVSFNGSKQLSRLVTITFLQEGFFINIIERVRQMRHTEE